MSTARRHLSLLLPLFGLLFSLQSLVLINRAISFREESLLQNYAITIASTKKLELKDISGYLPEIADLVPLDSDFLLQKFKDLDENIQSLKAQLPFFYQIKLLKFPKESDLKNIQDILSKLDFITNFETFSKTHNQVYKLLYFIKQLVYIFGNLLFVLSFLLMLRVVQVWRFEHQRRMDIMSLLGASFWLKNRVLFRLAFIDSFIASTVIFIISLVFSYHEYTQDLLSNLGISGKIFSFGRDFLLMITASFSVCLICVFLAIFIKKKSLPA